MATDINIEQKAKAYDEALDRARNIYSASGCRDILCTLKTIFPELAESENERIRTLLISSVKNEMPIASEHNKELAIAWLENQGRRE